MGGFAAGKEIEREREREREKGRKGERERLGDRLSSTYIRCMDPTDDSNTPLRRRCFPLPALELASASFESGKEARTSPRAGNASCPAGDDDKEGPEPQRVGGACGTSGFTRG